MAAWAAIICIVALTGRWVFEAAQAGELKGVWYFLMIEAFVVWRLFAFLIRSRSSLPKPPR